MKAFFEKITTKFSFHYIAYTFLFGAIIFSFINLVSATTPNPGHPWAELGDGVFTFSSGQTVTPYTYSFPAANTTVLTTNSLVSVAQGGTGLGSIASGSVMAANSANTLSAVTWSSAGTKILTNTSGTITWENAASGMVYPGSGIPNSTGSSWGTSYSTNGSGTVLALATTPTFTTNITTPLVIGGTGTTSDLFLQTTSGVGATGADMHFLVGNAGGTEAMTILNNGNVGIGTTNPGSNKLQVNGNLGIVGGGLGINGSTQPGITMATNTYTGGSIYNTLIGGANTNGGLIAGWYFNNYDSSWNSPSVASIETIRGTAVDEGVLTFGTRASSGSLTRRMSILGNGKVGIGTTNPDSILHIDGSTDGTGAGPDAILHVKQNNAWSGNLPWALYVEGYSALNGLLQISPDGSGYPFSLTSGSPSQIISSNSGSVLSAITASNDSWKRSEFATTRSRGTISSPEAVQVDDYMGTFSFYGYDGSNLQLPALVGAFC